MTRLNLRGGIRNGHTKGREKCWEVWGWDVVGKGVSSRAEEPCAVPKGHLSPRPQVANSSQQAES